MGKFHFLQLFLIMVWGLEVRADSDPKTNPDFGRMEYYGGHGPGDDYYKGKSKLLNLNTFIILKLQL